MVDRPKTKDEVIGVEVALGDMGEVGERVEEA